MKIVHCASATLGASAPATDAQLLTAIRRALTERRQVVDIGAYSFRFQLKSEEFDDGDFCIRALESGIFVKCPTERSGVAVDGSWVHLGSSDHLEAMVGHYVSPLSPAQRDAVRINLTANAVLQSMATERAASRRLHQ
jgi:hypothetical protein